MRFLIVMKNKFPFPPEATIPLMEGMRGWIKQNTANKKMEQSFGFAGLQAGGGILNVSSPDELDAVMVECPFGPFCETEVYALTDVDRSLSSAINAVKKMMPPQR